MPRKIIKLICENCGIKFERLLSEHKRSLKRGMKSFCTQSCATIYLHKGGLRGFCRPELPKPPNSGIQRDEYSPFRYFMKMFRNRSRDSKKTINVDLQYIKKIWDKQKGICPMTGWKLELPHGSQGWKNEGNTRRASVDRIDNSKGYVKENIRFVSVMFNYCRNGFEDEDVIEFCKVMMNNMINKTPGNCNT